jgi:hypothetical protein
MLTTHVNTCLPHMETHAYHTCLPHMETHIHAYNTWKHMLTREPRKRWEPKYISYYMCTAYVWVHVYAYTCVRHMYGYMCTCIHVFMLKCSPCVCVCVRVCLAVRACACVCTYACKHMYGYVCPYIHVFMFRCLRYTHLTPPHITIEHPIRGISVCHHKSVAVSSRVCRIDPR